MVDKIIPVSWVDMGTGYLTYKIMLCSRLEYINVPFNPKLSIGLISVLRMHVKLTPNVL